MTDTGQLPIRGKVTRMLAGHFFARCRRECLASLDDRFSTGYGRITSDNNFSLHAIDAIIFAVTGLESFINEIFADYIFKNCPQGIEEYREMINWSLYDKYFIGPQKVWGRTYDSGSRLFRDFRALVRTRNALIHYQVDEESSYVPGEGPSFIKTLKNQNLLLIPPDDQDRDYPWVHMLCTSKAAIWAFNLSCEITKKMSTFEESVIPKGWVITSERLQVISQDEYREYLQGKSNSK